MATFSENLKSRMDQLGVKNVQLAENIGVTRRMVELYLSGNKTPSHKAILKIGKYLDFNPLKFDGGARNGLLAYPPFMIHKRKIIRLHAVTGVIKRNLISSL